MEQERISLAEEEGNVGLVLFSCVKKIGSNQKYIIVAERNLDSLDYWIYIKPIKNQYNDSVMGPFSESNFYNKKTELGIQKVEFDKTFDLSFMQ